ncbi:MULTISPECIES: UDP-N-acetylglucosamine 2-epimerase [Stutzerimonas]|uniref:UDP-N-acetylglucosamine 2-epimerase n=1 Tax=Stutzerimonas TaxID=2901164 RepID=UPI0005B4F30E|nr:MULTISPECIES: UDP-N-acetylglucosamine 2-epimerase [Stutzerimonas]KJS72971.1 MAG: UDP-N-acetylglucosamine 2-epimerase [[Pseudomonas] sp. BICA1-14]MCQ4233475.1 UDP-N-acetylglucosamine 2-epimerase [Stutzerimonas degradans]UIP31285.1 UDP-N-acetylglucosamine 2-epimerase [Stutzerimonas kunmingensis]
MRRKVAVFTGTRAEYGLLYWLMKDIQASTALELQVIVSGMHLSPEFGETWKVVESDGFIIDAKVEMLLSSDSDVGVVKSMGLGILGFADALDRLRPDVLVVLGDRFEALAVVQAALVMKIPVAHLHGGEITEGAYDDAIRHAITKMSYLHFVAAQAYRQRVIQLGEAPQRVFNVGAVGLDHLLRSERMTRAELSQSLAFDLNSPFLLVTYHPVTLAEEDPLRSFEALLSALDRFPEHKVIITYPNADNGGRAIIPLLEAYAQKSPERIKAIPSLGFKRYLSAVALADAVIGNSSSGIIEVPAFAVPTVNIGARQDGRLAAESVLHCAARAEDIEQTLRTALSSEFAEVCRSAVNPYGAGNASQSIVAVLEGCDLNHHKSFHDIG